MKFLNVFLILLMTSTICFAVVPNEIRYNGRLKSYQAPVNGARLVNFKIYPSETGGTPAWESGNKSIEVKDGIFSYVLSPDTVDWRGKDYWLEIAVDNKVLTPREKLVSQVYALHASSAEHISSSGEISVKSGANSCRMGVNASGEVYTKSNVAGETEFYMVPKGAIILWSGSAANIPAGWALCDGTRGTPNLQGRFVVGKGTLREGVEDYVYEAHDIGGEAIHKLTIAEMPSHKHDVAAGGLGRSPSNSTESFLCNGGGPWPGNLMFPAGGDQPHNNIPPYYALCYIMKL